MTEATAPPVLRLVRGAPTPEELAAVVAVLLARSGAVTVAEPAPAPPRLWSRPQLRTPLTPGPGAWRASALPL